MKSISTKLAITFITIFLIVIAIISSVLIFTSMTSTKELMLNGMKSRTELQSESLDQSFSNRATVIQSVAEIIMNMDDLSPDNIQGVISPIYDSHEEYNLYVGLNNNQAFFADYWEPDSSWIATERDWYIAGAENPGVVASTEPYVDKMTGEICFTMVYGMVKDGQLTGVVALDIMQDALLNIMQDPKYTADGQYSMLLDKEGNIYYHPDSNFAPSNEGMSSLKEIDADRFMPILNPAQNQEAIVTKDFDGNKSYYIPIGIDGTNWIVCGVILTSELEKKMVGQIIFTILVGGISLLLAIFIVIYFVKRMITVPIKHMVEAARVMSTGDLDISINTDADDELGEFGRAFQSIIHDTQTSVKTIQAVADGDLTQNITIRSQKDIMRSALSEMLGKNNSVMSEISRSSVMVANCSRQIADISQSLSSGSSEQSEAVEHLSSNISEIADLTRQNMQKSLDASSLGDEIVKAAEDGSAQMSEMLKAVNEIDEASRSIGNVIKTIDDIAFQTNILALNAAVEAARAGTHGKGFAVVAEEVRNLATKSAEAAKNTGSLISASMEKSELGSRLASQTSASFEQIVSKLSLNIEKIKEMSSFSEKQVEAIKFIDDKLQSVLRVVQQNSASSEETAAAAEKMNEQSLMLEKAISQFRLKDK